MWIRRAIGEDGDGRYAPEHVTTTLPLWVCEPGRRLVAEKGARAIPESKRPDLSVRVDATWMNVLVRVDAIQRRALLEMAAAWNEQGGEDDIVTAMTVLADTVAGDPTCEQEDAAVEAVAEAAMLQDAEASMPLSEARRLRDELDAAIAKAERREVPQPGAARVSERAA